MASEHIVRSYDEELTHLRNTVTRMGGLAESQIAASVDAVMQRDSELAEDVIRNDDKVDQHLHDIESLVVRLLALRQPMARDLREILSALRIASDLERIADYATNMARRAIALNLVAPVRPVQVVPRMAQLVQSMIKDVLDAFIAHDAEKAVAVWESDEEVDEMYNSLFRELLTYMMEDPRAISTCTHLLFIAKNIERIGDHITNVAELIYYTVRGEPLKVVRKKVIELPDIQPGRTGAKKS
jgi:phosphate transport system protein